MHARIPASPFFILIGFSLYSLLDKAGRLEKAVMRAHSYFFASISFMARIYKWANENRELLMKSAGFIGASFLDYYLTELGISKGILEEANPILNYCHDVFGPGGMYLPKIIGAAVGVAGMYIADKNPDKTRIKSSHIFCIGTGSYLSASLLSLYHILR